MRRLSPTTAWLLALSVSFCLPAVPVLADGGPRVLYVPTGGVPRAVSKAVEKLIDKRGRRASTAGYRAAARRRRLRPSSVRALRRVGTRGGVRLMVVATTKGRRTLLLTYRRGNNAGRIMQGEYRISSSGKLGKAAKKEILSDLKEVLGGRRRTASGSAASRRRASSDSSDSRRRGARERERDEEDEDEDEDDEDDADEDDDEDDADEDDDEDEDEDDDEDEDEDDDEDEDEDDEGLIDEEEGESPLTAALTGGFGLGNRAINLPTLGGNAELATRPFPTFHANMLFGIETSSARHFQIGLQARYFTSAALKVNDVRPDGTTRTVDARSQHLAAGLHFRFNILEKERSPYIVIGAGYGFRFFSSEQAVTVPGFTLAGPYLRPGVFFHIGSGPLRVGLIPDFGFLVQVGEQLRDQGVASSGAIFGGEAQLFYRVLRPLDLGFMFRESHARVSAADGGTFTDAERFVMLLLRYEL
ncbi:MAG: hypothetical protein ACPGUV_10540 [Polyangiales bacterium]